MYVTHSRDQFPEYFTKGARAYTSRPPLESILNAQHNDNPARDQEPISVIVAVFCSKKAKTVSRAENYPCGRKEYLCGRKEYKFN